ncbi:MAG: hypothetical protein NTV94_03975 [Planctomycetota bacterium]|nr:hypothetical protein [Planctomycetota bacterium]
MASEFLAQGAVRKFEGTRTGAFERIEDDGDASARGVELDSALGHHLFAVLRHESRSLRGGLEHHAVDDRTGILEVKVPVGAIAKAGDFA